MVGEYYYYFGDCGDGSYGVGCLKMCVWECDMGNDDIQCVYDG